MLDRDSPPQEEGDTNGAGDGVRRDAARAVRRAARARSIREFSPLAWIIVTEAIWAAIMVTEAGVRDGPAFPRLIRWPTLNRYPLRERMRPRASLPLSRTCFSSARFRLPASR